jgi:endonuclease-3 related protein
MMIGAILTQNTAWSNVEKAITHLKSKNLLSLTTLRDVDLTTLEECIRPSGFFKQKSERIKRLVGLIESGFEGSIKTMAKSPLSLLRKTLLELNGIGPETADSMLLYALEKPVFVVDAYTRRIFGRLTIISGGEPYEEIRTLFESNLPAEIYNQYHALIVQTAKDFCKKRNPLCSECPLKGLKQCHPSLFS